MKDNLRITMRAFVYFSLIVGICLGMGFSIKSGNVLKGFAYGLVGGIFSSAFLSSYMMIGFMLFNKKIFFYSNMPEQLQKKDVRNIYYESVAGNATSARVKYGGLFLTDNFVLFIPHRFAIRPVLVQLPLKAIKEVKKTGINLLKWFSGGLRNRLHIETVTGDHYEFSVWDIDVWIKKINERRKTERRDNKDEELGSKLYLTVKKD